MANRESPPAARARKQKQVRATICKERVTPLTVGVDRHEDVVDRALEDVGVLVVEDAPHARALENTFAGILFQKIFSLLKLFLRKRET